MSGISKPLALSLLAQNTAKLLDYTDYQASIKTSFEVLESTLAEAGAAYVAPAIPVVLVTPKTNAIMVVFEGRSGSNASDPGSANTTIDVVMRKSFDGGLTWSDVKKIRGGSTDPSGTSYGGASVLINRASGRLHMFLHGGSVVDGASGTGNSNTSTSINHLIYSYSDDDGETWQPWVRMTNALKDASWYGIVTPGGAYEQVRTGAYKGRLVFPLGGLLESDWRSPCIASVYSDDDGATWTRGATLGGGFNESKIVELSNGTLLLDARDQNASYTTPGVRLRATSTDGGATWTAATSGPIPITKVNCAISRVDTDNTSARKDWLLFTGPKGLPSNPGSGRYDMSVWLSKDNGTTFPISKTINANTSLMGQYSEICKIGPSDFLMVWEGIREYPDGTLTPNVKRGSLHMTRFNLDAWLLGNKGSQQALRGPKDTSTAAQAVETANRYTDAKFAAAPSASKPQLIAAGALRLSSVFPVLPTPKISVGVAKLFASTTSPFKLATPDWTTRNVLINFADYGSADLAQISAEQTTYPTANRAMGYHQHSNASLTQADASKLPNWVASAFGGRGGFNFNPSNADEGAGWWETGVASLGTAHTHAIVFTVPDRASFADVRALIGGTGYVGFKFGAATTVAAGQSYASVTLQVGGLGGAAVTQTYTGTFVTGQSVRVVVRRNGTAVDVWFNGVKQTAITAAAGTFTNAFVPTFVGASGTTAAPALKWVSSQLLNVAWDAALSDAQCSELAGRLELYA